MTGVFIASKQARLIFFLSVIIIIMETLKTHKTIAWFGLAVRAAFIIVIIVVVVRRLSLLNKLVSKMIYSIPKTINSKRIIIVLTRDLLNFFIQ